MNDLSVGAWLSSLISIDMAKIAFIAIGHTATAVASDMKPFLDSIMAQVKEGLQNRWYAYNWKYFAFIVLAT